MYEVKSTEVSNFKEIAKEFMIGSRVTMMVCLYQEETDQLIIHAAWALNTEMEDLIIESDEMDNDMIVIHQPKLGIHR